MVSVKGALTKQFQYEINCIKENIAIKKKMGKDASFEKGLLKSYERYQQGEVGDGHF